MPKRRTVSRWTLSRRLQEVALRIAAGKPIKLGGVNVTVPDRVTLEEELEATEDGMELEFEISWPGAASRPPRRRAAARASPRRR